MIFFRADSNDIIASGHIMRCISIASYFREKGYDVTFLIADKNPVEMLEKAELDYYILNSKWNDLSYEYDTIVSCLKREENPILIIDTYSVNKEYVDKVSPFARVCYLGSKKEYLGNLAGLINYSTDIDESFYKLNYPKTKLLLGPSYAPLRKEFQNVEEHYTNNDFRILLTTGNSDPYNCTSLILQYLIQNEIIMNYSIDVVVGRMFNDVDGMVSKFSSFRNIRFYQGANLSELMKSSSLAISANGTTVYELAASHVPIISFALVREQVKSAETLFNLGVLKYAGQMYSNKDECISSIIQYVLAFIANPSELEIIGKNAYKVIGGNGCEKIFDLISTL